MNERAYVNVLNFAKRPFRADKLVVLPFDASKKAMTQYGKSLAKADPAHYSGYRTLMVKTVKGMGLL